MTMPERLSKFFGDARMCLHHTSRHCSASPRRKPITQIERGFFGNRAESLSHGRVYARAWKRFDQYQPKRQQRTRGKAVLFIFL